MSEDVYTEEDYTDTLQEVMNIALGRAGKMLAGILDIFVIISVPRVRFTTSDGVITNVSALLDSTTDLSALSQSFSKDLKGEAVALFEPKSLFDLSELTGRAAIDENSQLGLLKEITSVLVGTLMEGVSEILDRELELSEPKVLNHCADISDILSPDRIEWSHAFLTEINFSLEDRNFKCHIFMFVTENTIEALYQSLDTIMEEM